MSTTNEKIATLRGNMAKEGVNAYIIPSTDSHMSEYVPDHWKVRAFVSGFTGSAGTLVVTDKESALWTDGRYFPQATKQLEGSEVLLQKMGVEGTPSIEEWLSETLPANSVVGFDGMVQSEGAVRRLHTALATKQMSLKSVDLIDDSVWPNRPAAPSSKAWSLPVEYAGRSSAEKQAQVRQKMTGLGADGVLLTRLDSVAWLLNLRGDDVEDTPYSLAYVYVDQTQVNLYINKEEVSDALSAALKAEGVTCFGYDEIQTAMETEAVKGNILLDPESVNYTFFTAVKENPWTTVIEGTDPIIPLKALKNDVERACSVDAHIRDGVAMVRFQKKMEERLAAGDTLTEWDISLMIYEERAKIDKYLSESFTSIAAYGPNAAMMHYAPSPETAATLKKEGFLLLDSGGQYEDGTTDITRTYAMTDQLDYFSRRYYTLVLLCHIRMAKGVFLAGNTGGNVDILARETLWREGLDYRCGTGHGVAFVGTVHEGPQNLRGNNTVILEPTMNITIEPGIYENQVLGIRIENEYFVEEKFKTEYGQFLGFETFTVCPIDTTPILVGMMQQEEIDWLNEYHKEVYQKLEPLLNEDEKGWLTKKCAPISKEV